MEVSRDQMVKLHSDLLFLFLQFSSLSYIYSLFVPRDACALALNNMVRCGDDAIKLQQCYLCNNQGANYELESNFGKTKLNHGLNFVCLIGSEVFIFQYSYRTLIPLTTPDVAE